jgi:Family of unknown function (DUF6221)
MSVATVAGSTTQDLVRFLLARIDDDEAELKRLARRGVDEDYGVRSVPRLQADAASKRRLIGALQQLLVLRDQPSEKAVRDHATQMLRVLAVAYDTHLDYRREWRPSGSH